LDPKGGALKATFDSHNLRTKGKVFMEVIEVMEVLGE